MRKRKAVAVFLFFLGFAIVLYPPFSKMYYDIQIQEEVEQIIEDMDDRSDHVYQQHVEYNQKTISNIANIEVANVGYVDDEFNESGTGAIADATNSGRVQAAGSEYDRNNTQTHNIATGVLGTLHIPKINLIYPIYDGATDDNLLKGVARIDGTSFPVGGINTNSVIAGHNSMARRNYFTHIKDLVNGDIVQIRNQKEILTYEVYATAIIEPDNTGALAVIPGQDTVTLLTCTWPPPGTHRYLVYAKRVSDKPVASAASNN